MVKKNKCQIVTPPIETTDKVLGSRLRTIRQQKGADQSDLAKCIHSDRTLVSHFERGKRELKLRFWPGLARGLEIGADAFALMLVFDLTHEQAAKISDYIAACMRSNRRNRKHY